MRLNENSTEHFLQSFLLIIIIALKFTKTGTVFGLREMFASGNMALILMSSIWSIVSMVLGHLHWMVVKKDDFLPLKGKVCLAVLGLISQVSRIFAVLLYFSPSLGLMDLLMHWKMGALNAKTHIYDIRHEINKI
jgi:hypothetical protein